MSGLGSAVCSKQPIKQGCFSTEREQRQELKRLGEHSPQTCPVSSCHTLLCPDRTQINTQQPLGDIWLLISSHDQTSSASVCQPLIPSALNYWHLRQVGTPRLIKYSETHIARIRFLHPPRTQQPGVSLSPTLPRETFSLHIQFREHQLSPGLGNERQQTFKKSSLP